MVFFFYEKIRCLLFPKEGIIKHQNQGYALYFYDNGRYATLDEYSIQPECIHEAKIIKLLEELVSEDTYTAANYVPDKYTINQLIISHFNVNYY